MYVLQITYPMLVASSVANSQALHSHRQDAWNERHQQDDAMQLPAKEERSLSLGEVFRFEVNATGGRARPTGWREEECEGSHVTSRKSQLRRVTTPRKSGIRGI